MDSSDVLRNAGNEADVLFQPKNICKMLKFTLLNSSNLQTRIWIIQMMLSFALHNRQNMISMEIWFFIFYFLALCGVWGVIIVFDYF